MSSVLIEVFGARFHVDDKGAVDLSVPLDFKGRQPRFFGAPAASSAPLQAGDFSGDVRAGGSCNCEVLTLVPHCNGTHTECLGHVTGDRVSVAGKAREGMMAALLLSVPLASFGEAGEATDPPAPASDMLVTAGNLRQAQRRLGHRPVEALVIRTLPNPESKRFRDWGRGVAPPCLSLEAVDLLVDWRVRHVLLDLPSLDRARDEGRLAGHRRFWGLPHAGVDAADASRADATITEMIYVPDAVEDGLYALSLQVAPFVTDAAPSRPLLYPLAPA